MATSLPSPAIARLRGIGIPVGVVLLTLLFVVIGFPYDRIRDLVASQASQALQAQVRIGSLGPAFSLLGPGIEAGAVDIAFADGGRIAVSEAKLRPAWSFSWLRGRPAIHLDVTTEQGRAAGTLTLGSEPGFDGTLDQVDLAKLPLSAAFPGLSIDGIASGDLDLRQTLAGPRGSIDLEAADGSVAVPGMPIALPFQKLTASTQLTDAHLAENLTVDLQGPMLTAQISGNVGQSPILMNAPLELAVKMVVVDESLRPMLSGTGMRFAQDGSAEMRLLGTAGRPILR